MIELIDKQLVSDKEQLFNSLKIFLQDKFQISGKSVDRYLYDLKNRYLANLEDGLVTFLIEFPYTDKVYRDSYYHYYASKLYSYKRDCIRVSIFKKGIDHSFFRDSSKTTQLGDLYLGFFIVRPLTPALLGRNAIARSAFIHGGDLLVMTAPISSAINGIKLSIKAFPHSSQDSETISCAETTLWSLMEYFGNKYPEYKPTLPSKIHEILSSRKPERQVPSNGLQLMDISFVLKKFGFGSKVYTQAEFGDKFFQLLKVYVESGIPVVTTLQGKGIGHANICIGRRAFNPADLATLIPEELTFSDPMKEPISIFFNSRIEREFVFIDDNWGPYQTADIARPCAHYGSPDWDSCRITAFVVPLYPKVYLEAFQVENYMLSYLKNYLQKYFEEGEKLFFRMFLASSRSFKQHIALNSDLSETAREVLVSCTMPKFIWVAELSTLKLINAQKGNGLIVIDATEVNIIDNKPLILSVFQNVLTIWNDQIGELEDIPLHLENFTIYTNNLGGF